jgi:hypothetical protein
MKQKFVPYELAFRLKQLGFDEPCISHYTAYGKFSNDYSAPRKYNSEFELGSYISAPTFSQAFEFFREKYNLEGIVQRAEDSVWYKFSIYLYLEECKRIRYAGYEYTSYGEAEISCLTNLIQIVEYKTYNEL